MKKNQVFFVSSLILAIVATLFALTNANPVNINLLFYQFEASQAIVILLSVMLGAVVAVLLGLMQHVKMLKELKKLRKENEDLKLKIDAMSRELSMNQPPEPVPAFVAAEEIVETEPQITE